ncbi:serine hydrolase domain-containing protein [Urechidicola vernalis]|uniref:Serine hydrolase domain-containing protein n=1 Tax=Urechidicola vernalis TaxID=3075600 RepID=A0ABU2Y141_9FLAO|nr:serine hydrolase domain-containing protein [Urechidicola sp. P050]MDT0551727.1 serine hydrolase domain-containing protein [Urechidicola sp. P050]
MKTLITIITMALSISFANAQKSASEKELLSTLDENTPKALKEHKVPGLAIAVIKNEKVIVKKGYGFADVEAKIEVNSETGFNIGSISKMFTAWGIMILVEDGRLDLDAPAATYITKWQLPESEFDTDKITIRNLMQHTAGLSVHGYNGYESRKELSSTVESLLGTSREEEAVIQIMEPESEWKYSGGGYTILQLVIEEVTGRSFADYMQKTIFTPLKMNQTSFNINKQLLKKSAKPYDENGKEIALRSFNAQAAAGLHTTLDDLIIFAKTSYAPNPVLSEKSIQLLTNPTEFSKGNYGMGYMEMNRFGDFTLHGHGGSNEGWHAGFMLDFESKSGIIILTNGESGRNVLFGDMKDWAQWHGSN